MCYNKTYPLFKWLAVALIPWLASCSRTRIDLDALPINTPIGSSVYISGNFNNWNPGDPDYKLTYDEVSKKWYTELPLGFGKVEYKFTRGDWTTVEADSCGGDTENRTQSVGSTDTTYNWISGWKDLAPVYCNRLTIVLDTIPSNTPGNSPIYLSGNVNYWALADVNFKFKKGEDERYYLTVPRTSEKLVFKLNRGTFESVEMDENHMDIEPREIQFGNQDSVHITMRSWFDLPETKIVIKTIVLDAFPPVEPGTKIYLSGSFNNWHPKDDSYAFKRDRKGKYYYNFQFGEKDAEYFKVTLGGWDKCELKPSGSDMNNRLLLKSEGDTLHITIGKWSEKNNQPVTAILQKAEELSNVVNTELLKKEPPKPANKPNEATRKIIFIIEKAPEMRKADERIYLTGDFNNWVTDMPGFDFKNLANGKRYFVLRLYDNQAHEFKITRGDWGKEEADRYRNKFDNKKIEAGNKDDTIRLSIANWVDYLPAKRVTVTIEELPSNTPAADDLYLTGDFNGWIPNDAAYRFKTINGKRYVSIPFFTENYNSFKITRGDWKSEFTGSNGKVLPDQSFKRLLKQDTVFYKVKGWKDLN